MIKSRADLKRYLLEDVRHYDPALKRWSLFAAIKYPTLAWTRKLRVAEYWINRSSGTLSKAVAIVYRMRARSAGMKLGFSIPPNVFGPGLRLPHWGTIVVNDRARIGARASVHPGTVIGVKNGEVPEAGDDVYFGPGCKVIGGVVLGNQVRIGANAVVTKSAPSRSILIGIPAKAVGTDHYRP